MLVLACIAGLNMFFVTKRFYGLHGRLPVRIAVGSVRAVYFKIEENCEKGYFSGDEADRCRERFCTTFDWLVILNRFSLPLAVFDCTGMVWLIALVILEQVLRHEVRFFTIYGVAGFLVVMQTAWLYIFSRYMFNAVQAWIERLLSEPKNVDARHKNATKAQRSNKDNPLTIENGVVIKCKSDATEVVIPDGVTYIGGSTFELCYSLAGIVIPKGVKEIDGHAFRDCKSLSEIRFAGTRAQWETVKKGNDWNNGVPAKVVHCADGDVGLCCPRHPNGKGKHAPARKRC